MKTSLNLQDSLFAAAKKESHSTGLTISEIISRWAWAGRRVLIKKRTAKKLKTADLGGSALIDLSSRRHWLDLLDKERK